MPSLLAAVLLAALTLVACGGGSGPAGGSDASASQLLDQTFGQNAKIRSGRITLAFDADVKDVAQPVAIRLNGPFQSSASKDQLPKFDFTVKLTSSGKTTELGAISTGDKGFLKYQGANYAVPDQLFKQFASRYADVQKQADSAKGSTPSLLSLGIHPRAWLVDPKKVGEADVGGTRTIHIAAGIDTAKLLADIQKAAAKASSVSNQAQSLSTADVTQLQKAIKSAHVDIYTGADDQRLRKFALDVRLTTGHVLLALQYDHLDEPQTIAAPANAQSLDGLTGALSGSGSGGSGGTQTTPAPSASSGSNGQYLDCVRKAGQDLAKVQTCNKYLP